MKGKILFLVIYFLVPHIMHATDFIKLDTDDSLVLGEINNSIDVKTFVDQIAIIYGNEYLDSLYKDLTEDLQYIKSLIWRKNQGWVPNEDLLIEQQINLINIQKRWDDRGSIKLKNLDGIKRRYANECLFDRWEKEYAAIYNTLKPYHHLVLSIPEIIFICVGGTFTIAHKAKSFEWSPTIFWTGVGFLVAGGSLIVGHIILAGNGIYQTQKRKKWLIDLEPEILESTNRYLETVDFDKKFPSLRSNIKKGLDELNNLL